MNKARNPEFIIAFGKNLRKIRKDNNLSMEELARLANVEYSQISEIELGKINTTISTVYILSKALKIDIKDLFEFSI